MGLTHGLHTHDLSHQVPRLVGASLAHTPAALLIGALAALIYAVSPSHASAGWALLVVSLILAQLGRALGLSHWIVDLSPFTHSPNLPGRAAHLKADAVLVTLATLATLGGLVAFSRRDVG